MRPNMLSHIYSSMNTVLFVNATIGFSENLFLVSLIILLLYIIYVSNLAGIIILLLSIYVFSFLRIA